MVNAFNSSIFKTVLEPKETKLDASSRNARNIVASETALRAAMTERLKAARLAREAEIALSPPSEPAPKTKRSKKSATPS